METIAKTSKYHYQGAAAPTTPAAIRDHVIQCLSLESQRFAFAAGKIDTVLFDFEDRASRPDAIKTMTALHETQSPKVSFVAGLKDIYDGQESQITAYRCYSTRRTCFTPFLAGISLPSKQAPWPGKKNFLTPARFELATSALLRMISYQFQKILI